MQLSFEMICSLKVKRRMHDEGLPRTFVDESYTKIYCQSASMMMGLKSANIEVATTKGR